MDIRVAASTDIAHIAQLAHRDASWVHRVRTQMARGLLDVFLASQAEPLDLPGYAIIQRQRVVSPRPVHHAFIRLVSAARQRPRTADPASLLLPKPTALIQEVFVRPEYRHCEVDAALVRCGIGHVHAEGLDDVRVYVKAGDSGLYSFYHHLGFSPVQAYLSKPLTGHDPHAPETSRPATAGDRSPLSALVREAILHQQTLTSAFQLRTDINWRAHTTAKHTHRDIHLRVIDRDRRLAAFIELRLVGQPPFSWRRFITRQRGLAPASAPRYGVVQEVYVSPSMRRRGLATLLLQDAHRWFESRRIATVRAAIWNDNHSSLTLFQNAGYEIDERMMRRVGRDG